MSDRLSRKHRRLGWLGGAVSHLPACADCLLDAGELKMLEITDEDRRLYRYAKPQSDAAKETLAGEMAQLAVKCMARALKAENHGNSLYQNWTEEDWLEQADHELRRYPDMKATAG